MVTSLAPSVVRHVLSPFVAALSWLCRRDPRVPGLWRLRGRLIRLTRKLYPYDCGPVTIRLRHGIRIAIDRADFLGSHLYVSGVYEPRSVHLIRKLLRPGDCFLDIGANVGYFTLIGARAVGSQGQVHAFEPQPELANRLKSNLQLNKFTNAVVHRQLVANEASVRKFFLGPPDHRGISSVRDLGTETAGELRVPCISIDSILADLPPVRLVKMDVEGAELLALKGMRRLIRRDNPSFVLELSDQYLRQIGDTAIDLFSFLSARGYNMWKITYRGLEKLSFPPQVQCNVFATTKSHGPSDK